MIPDVGAPSPETTERIPFPRPLAALPFDGERFTHDARGPIELEHVHRYLFARRFCRGLDILDAASGEGYGSALLGQVARRVTGVEKQEAAAAHASAAYGSDTVRFLVGDCLDLPLPDASVDVYVSFETLEHVEAHERLLDEAARVLRPGGLLVISTPDRRVYSEEAGRENPFHLRELDRAEFEALLRTRFAHVALHAQKAVAASLIMPLGAAEPGLAVHRRLAPSVIEGREDIAAAPYLVALASDTPPPATMAGLYEDAAHLGGAGGDAAAEILAAAGLKRSEDARLACVFDMRDTPPAAAGATQLSRCGPDLAILARDADPQLLARLRPHGAPWLLARIDITVEQETTLQLYTRIVGEPRVDPATGVIRRLPPGRRVLHLLLWRDGPIDLVRFDPGDRPGAAILSGFAIFAPTASFA
jgi:SAM-dependent methyltransferase